MSITSSGARKAGPYNCNGSTTDFPFAFKVFQASDVLVVQTDTTPADNIVASNNYTVLLNANQDSNPGGTVRMNAAPQNGYLLTIGSQVPQIQSVTLTNTGGFYPTVINNALDYLTILIQQLSEKIGRALTMPFSTNASGQLPPVSPGSLLGWKADGTGIANVGATGVGASGIVASNMAAGATGTALSTDTQAAATKTTPADTDKIPLFDSASFWYLKGLTWANLKAAFLNNGFSTITGSQMQISGDLSPLWEGTQSTLTSGAAYVLNGNILIMKARTHNVKIDTSGNFTGVSKTGIATVEFWGEDDVIRVFTAPSVTAGTMPTFGATPTYTLDLKTGLITPTPPIRSYLAGCAMSTAGASTTMNIAAGQATDSTNVISLNLAAIAKTTAAWAAGTSQGGKLNAAAMAPFTWYYFFLIRRPDTGVIDVGFDIISSTPTLPANYTQYRYIGAGLLDGSSNWTLFTQSGREFYWFTPVLDFAAAGSATATLLTCTVPRGRKVKAFFNVSIQNASGAGQGAYISDPANADLVPSATLNPLSTVFDGPIGGGGATYAGSNATCWTNISAQVRHREINTNSIGISTLGWIDLADTNL